MELALTVLIWAGVAAAIAATVAVLTVPLLLIIAVRQQARTADHIRRDVAAVKDHIAFGARGRATL